MNNIIFRNAVKEDFEIFNEIYTKTTFLGWSHFEITPKTFDEFLSLVQNEEIIFLELDEKIIGYAMIKAYDDGECIIKNIYILESYQGKSYGWKLVSYIERLARECGITKMSLTSETHVTDRVWEKMGYRSVNNTDKYVKMLI